MAGEAIFDGATGGAIFGRRHGERGHLRRHNEWGHLWQTAWRARPSSAAPRGATSGVAGGAISGGMAGQAISGAAAGRAISGAAAGPPLAQREGASPAAAAVAGLPGVGWAGGKLRVGLGGRCDRSGRSSSAYDEIEHGQFASWTGTRQICVSVHSLPKIGAVYASSVGGCLNTTRDPFCICLSGCMSCWRQPNLIHFFQLTPTSTDRSCLLESPRQSTVPLLSPRMSTRLALLFMFTRTRINR